MDRSTRLRGGSAIWSTESPAGTIINNEFFGATPAKTLWVNVAGVWKQCVAWIKVSGVWKQAELFLKEGDWI